MKFRFALLVAALALALSISAFAYSEEPAQDTAAPAQEKTTSEDSAPFVLLRVYEGQFADVKDGGVVCAVCLVFEEPEFARQQL